MMDARSDPNSPRVIDKYLYKSGRSGLEMSLYEIFTIIGMIKIMDELSLFRPNVIFII